MPASLHVGTLASTKVGRAMMYADELLPTLEQLAERAVSAEGLELAWVEFKRQGGSWVLRVFIERPSDELGADAESQRVGLQDCERVTARLGFLLDAEDPIDSSYTLEVSTPGLDRPLRKAGDYQRFVGRLARVKTKQLLDGRRRFLGRLRGVEDGSVLLDEPQPASKRRKSGGSERRLAIPLSTIESGRLEVEISELLQPARKPGRRQ